ncbi:MAG: phosphate ABC transporter permease PstC, partial [Candidatus Omnitrophica bacterium]|nr:phosphate ABC transporter permease PstC [Candidatus Omnitrophota bacterium]
MDLVFSLITGIASISVIIIVVGILYVLFSNASLSIGRFGFLKFITSVDWDPVKESFGAAAALYGTLVTTFFALIFAIPIALGIAIFVTEVAPHFLKGPIGIAIELLAAIPSIIYGMWGFFTLAPIMANYIEPFLQKTIGGLPLLGILFKGTPM